MACGGNYRSNLWPVRHNVMRDETAANATDVPRMGARCVGAALILAGIVGWSGSVPTLPGYGSLALESWTGGSFALCGVALWLLQLRGRPAARLAAGCAAMVGGLAGYDLFNHLAGMSPGRMSPCSAISFLLTAASLALLSRPPGNVRRPMILGWLGVAVVTICQLSVLGKLADFQIGYGNWSVTAPSLHTVALFVPLGLALLAFAWREAGLRWLIESWISAGFTLGMALLVVVAALSYRSTRRLVRAEAAVNASHRTLEQISGLRSRLDKERRELPEILTAGREISPLLAESGRQTQETIMVLRELLADHAGQTRRLEEMVNLVREWQGLLQTASERQRTEAGAATAAWIGAGPGKDLPGRIDLRLRWMDEQERAQLTERLARSEEITGDTFALLPLGMVASLVLLFSGLLWLNAVMAGRQRVDEALRRSGRRLGLALEAAEIGEWELDLATRLLRCSLRHDQIFGYAEMVSDWNYERFLEHVHPDDRERVDQELQQSVASGSGWAFECRIIRQDGSEGWIVENGAPMRDTSGKLVELIGTVRDISSQKRIETELRLTTERFQRALHDSPIVVMNQDLDLRYTWVYNPTKGYDPALILGRQDRDIFDYAEDAAVAEAIKRDVIQTGRRRREEILVRWQGENRYYDLVVDPLLDPSGRCTGVTCVGVEITARKEAETARRKVEESLKKSETTLILAVEGAQLGIWDWDITSDTLVWSERRKAMSGLAPDAEITYAIAANTVHPDDHDVLQAADDHTRKMRADGLEDFRTVWPDGTVRWLQDRGRVFTDESGTPVHYTGITMDVTERREADEALRASRELLAVAIDAGQLGVWVWESRGRSLVFNEQCNAILGLSHDDSICEATALSTVHPNDRERILAEARFAMERKKDLDLEYRTVRADGSLGWIHASGRAFDDAAGKLVRIAGIIHDVTGRRESEEELKRLNSSLESMVDERTEVIKVAMKELHKEFAERRRLEEEILEIGERERARIGQDLHDELGQQLVGMAILMQLLASQLKAEGHPRAEEAVRLQTFLTASISTTRNLAKSLYPVELERGGLILSLQDLARRTELLAGITCTVEADEDFSFEKTAEIHLYRIVQESIGNSLKHAQATHIQIECTYHNGLSTLSVTDNGQGLTPPDEWEWSGIGLHLFQYRARLIGARLSVTQAENGGCRVTCTMGDPEAVPMIKIN